MSDLLESLLRCWRPFVGVLRNESLGLRGGISLVE